MIWVISFVVVFRIWACLLSLSEVPVYTDTIVFIDCGFDFYLYF